MIQNFLNFLIIFSILDQIISAPRNHSSYNKKIQRWRRAPQYQWGEFVFDDDNIYSYLDAQSRESYPNFSYEDYESNIHFFKTGHTTESFTEAAHSPPKKLDDDFVKKIVEMVIKELRQSNGFHSLFSFSDNSTTIEESSDSNVVQANDVGNSVEPKFMLNVTQNIEEELVPDQNVTQIQEEQYLESNGDPESTTVQILAVEAQELNTNFTSINTSYGFTTAANNGSIEGSGIPGDIESTTAAILAEEAEELSRNDTYVNTSYANQSSIEVSGNPGDIDSTTITIFAEEAEELDTNYTFANTSYLTNAANKLSSELSSNDATYTNETSTIVTSSIEQTTSMVYNYNETLSTNFTLEASESTVADR